MLRPIVINRPTLKTNLILPIMLLLLCPLALAQNIRGLDHIGMTVPDIDQASAFLEKAFGAKVLYDVLPKGGTPFEGAETEQQLGIPKKSRIVHMRLMQIGNGPTIEMFQFQNAKQAKSAALNDFGYQHLALYTDDIDTAAKQFKNAGGTLLSAPHPLAGVEEGANNKGVYGKTPWGSLVELITYPDGLKDKTLHRYTPDK